MRYKVLRREINAVWPVDKSVLTRSIVWIYVVFNYDVFGGYFITEKMAVDHIPKLASWK